MDRKRPDDGPRMANGREANGERNIVKMGVWGYIKYLDFLEI